jgi:hypothetical protein
MNAVACEKQNAFTSAFVSVEGPIFTVPFRLVDGEWQIARPLCCIHCPGECDGRSNIVTIVETMNWHSFGEFE